jgi:hypothetical protein
MIQESQTKEDDGLDNTSCPAKGKAKSGKGQVQKTRQQAGRKPSTALKNSKFNYWKHYWFVSNSF